MRRAFTNVGDATKGNLYFPQYWNYTSQMNFLQRFLRDEQGQDLIEYTLLIAFIALASASIFVSAGGSISSIWGSASTELSNAAVSAS
jgi:Flp pilus assembly pilin Flp